MTVTSTAYRHNLEGIQVGKATTVTVNGVAYPDLSETVNYLIDSANPTGYAQVIEERDGGGTVLKSYAIGDDVLSQSVPSSLSLQPSYFLYDGHGSTRQLTYAQGSVTALYAYDSYGVMLGQTAGAQIRQATDLLYSGERFDPALQQYYLRARNYNPANGQFTSLDPYSGNPHDPQSLHKYAYCHSDPVNGVDPSGEMSIGELAATSAIMATISCIVTTSYEYVVNKKNMWESFMSGLVAGMITGIMVFIGPQIGACMASIASSGVVGAWASVVLYTAFLGSLAYGVGQVLCVIVDTETTWMEKAVAFAMILNIILTAIVSMRVGSSAYAKNVEVVAAGNNGKIVSRWGDPGLRPNNWVMEGEVTLLNWYRSGMWNKHYVPFKQAYSYRVNASDLSAPSGSAFADQGIIGFIKNMMQQRLYTP